MWHRVCPVCVASASGIRCIQHSDPLGDSRVGSSFLGGQHLKDWIDLNAQVQKHVDRGLDLGGITNQKFAMFLYSSNYYRVSGYGRCFYEAGADRYIAGTTAAQLMDIYDIDRVLRHRILDGVGVFEPTLRSRVAFHVAKSIGGGDAYLKEDLYLPTGPEPAASDEKALTRWQKEVKNRDKVLESFRQVQTREEIFIKHQLAENASTKP